MPALIHSLQITTLATWLSVLGFGTIGLVIRPAPRGNTDPPPETRLIPQDFTLGDAPETTAAPTPAAAVPAIAESLPAPPEMPDTTEFAPLPEVPSPAPAIRQTRSTPAPASRAPSTASPRQAPRRSQPSSPAGQGMSAAARLAAGRMSPPAYPAEARRRGQTGTVVVEFTVDASGNVISAIAKSPSPWPLLNHEAVRTVRRWKFPPGPVMTLQRPIVFQLR